MTKSFRLIALGCLIFLAISFVLISHTALSAGTLKITTPNGGEDWNTGTKYTIKWKRGNGGSRVKIELMKSGKVYKTIKKATKNDGRYRWKIPSDVITGKKVYTIRVSGNKSKRATDKSKKFSFKSKGVKGC